jgi:hypothetical protein
MAACGALLLVGLAAGALWSGRSFCAPTAEGDLSAVEVARRFVWYASLALVSGVTAGITVIGAGGRLAMRLLAVTGGDEAQGRITEAEEVVGEISVDGTIGFILFNGIFGGVASAVLYLLVRRFLPHGWIGGVAFGLGLLMVLGTTIDPLRDENPDFDIVGPGWLSVAVFTALAVAFGITVAAVTTRLSAWLPLLSTDRRVLVRYAVPAAVAVVGFSVTAALVVVGAAVVLVTRWHRLVDAMRSRRTVLVGRVVLCGLLLVALPNALTTVVDIASR